MRFSDLSPDASSEVMRAMTAAAREEAERRGMSPDGLGLVLLVCDQHLGRSQLYSTMSPDESEPYVLGAAESYFVQGSAILIMGRDGVVRTPEDALSSGVPAIGDGGRDG